MKIYVVFYSTYGHVYQMAQAVSDGAKSVEGSEVSLFQVEETLSDEILEKMGAAEAKKAFEHIPLIAPAQLAEADAIIFGTPTRFGNMAAQMRALLDATGGLWKKGSLIGKIGSVFASTGSQHGGQETTITSFHTTLLHHGMVIVGVPYSCPGLTVMSEITGGTPYGATTMADADGSRQPTENELSIARFQGEHVAKLTRKLVS
ncbi:NAD(P)H:quinone oxidoreductase [Rubinisphaera margarita]|uniref:NAD(P)H:quinone oxidoreductase n=1 Tax=Rubinisphaera margarita TaxID=2909586 RepID=UPI001EE7E0B1|nr:NAD(P)H:quinone oxidoreductase [Rubinisphaera margarita]MCG6156416.1 NAD(P)H:quinone oxidoreductase [Rubinisphaera margarita]